MIYLENLRNINNTIKTVTTHQITKVKTHISHSKKKKLSKSYLHIVITKFDKTYLQ